MTTPSPPVLEARRLRRNAADGTPLLDDVSLSLPPGSSTAVVGQPGSGKTLLLRALCLLDPLQGGDVLFRGEHIPNHAVPAFRRQVILLQQRPVLIEGTVRNNLELPFAFHADAENSFDPGRAIEQLVQLNRPSAFLDREVAELSGGESQVVALLRAVQLNPTVLLLDEPTSSLDQETTAAFERLVASWQASGDDRTLLVVTHAAAQADRLADRILTMHQGRISTRRPNPTEAIPPEGGAP